MKKKTQPTFFSFFFNHFDLFHYIKFFSFHCCFNIIFIASSWIDNKQVEYGYFHELGKLQNEQLFQLKICH